MSEVTDQVDRIIKLRDQVEYCLKHFPKTRNSDVLLTIQVWATFYRSFVFRDNEGQWSIRFKDLLHLPREDNVKRIRAKLQNEKVLYLPSDQKVREARGISEEAWRKYLNYPSASGLI